jgi:hypothetical protein
VRAPGVACDSRNGRTGARPGRSSTRTGPGGCVLPWTRRPGPGGDESLRLRLPGLDTDSLTAPIPSRSLLSLRLRVVTMDSARMGPFKVLPPRRQPVAVLPAGTRLPRVQNPTSAPAPARVRRPGPPALSRMGPGGAGVANAAQLPAARRGPCWCAGRAATRASRVHLLLRFQDFLDLHRRLHRGLAS